MRLDAGFDQLLKQLDLKADEPADFVRQQRIADAAEDSQFAKERLGEFGEAGDPVAAGLHAHVPSAEEGARGRQHPALAAPRRIGRAPADVEVQEAGVRMTARERRAASQERQPRFQSRVVGRGNQRIADSLTHQAHDRSCVRPSRG